jgi:two-component system, NtrC family, response regulator GlrR
MRTLTLNIGRTSLGLPSIEVSVRLPRARPVVKPIGLAPLLIGSDPELVDVALADERISKRHCAVEITERGLRVRDLGSKNGVYVGEMRVADATIPLDTVITLAQVASVSFRETGPTTQIPLTSEVSFGAAVGGSPPMRALFAVLERAARTEETILLLGESGTGKEILARAIHDRSARKGGPFMPFDCGAVSPQLMEASLFGHVRGAFTGASNDHEGVLAASAGGTLFLDEIGELPLELQPKLLRALESRVYQPVGSREWRPFTGRIVAATHRDLGNAMRERRFRDDLYYRLAIVNVRVPPLRERREDVELLVEQFLHDMSPPRELRDLPPHALAMLEAHEWPGNVRELKNVVTRLVLFGDVREAFDDAGMSAAGSPHRIASSFRALLGLGLRDARDEMIAEFERWFVSEKLKAASGSVSGAAQAMGVSRQFLHRLMSRYAIKSVRGPSGDA